MVTAPIDVIDRGLLCDPNYLIEGNTLGSYDERDPETEYEEIPVYNLVIDHPEGTILRDTGNHEDALDDIDYVFQTHLHPDHAGGLHHFDGTDVPVFVHEEELERRHDAEVVYGHDPEQYASLEGWSS